jgi:MFS family permease
MVLLALSPNLAVAFPVAVLLGVASIAFMTTSTAIVQLLAGPTFRGRVLAIQAMVFLGSTPIGGPIVGWITDAAGPRAGVLVGAVACFVAAAYGASRLDLDHLPDGPPTPVADAQPSAPPPAALAD